MLIESKNKYVRRAVLIVKTPIIFILWCALVIKEEGLIPEFIAEWKDIWNGNQ